MTISSPQSIEKMLRNKGAFPGDPPAARIYSYQSLEGNPLFAVFLAPEHDDIYQSPYVKKPVLLMENGELTDEGKTFLSRNKSGPAPEM